MHLSCAFLFAILPASPDSAAADMSQITLPAYSLCSRNCQELKLMTKMEQCSCGRQEANVAFSYCKIVWFVRFNLQPFQWAILWVAPFILINQQSLLNRLRQSDTCERTEKKLFSDNLFPLSYKLIFDEKLMRLS